MVRGLGEFKGVRLRDSDKQVYKKRGKLIRYFLKKI